MNQPLSHILGNHGISMPPSEMGCIWIPCLQCTTCIHHIHTKKHILCLVPRGHRTHHDFVTVLQLSCGVKRQNITNDLYTVIYYKKKNHTFTEMKFTSLIRTPRQSMSTPTSATRCRECSCQYTDDSATESTLCLGFMNPVHAEHLWTLSYSTNGVRFTSVGLSGLVKKKLNL
jgi:hypothetical protein